MSINISTLYAAGTFIYHRSRFKGSLLSRSTPIETKGAWQDSTSVVLDQTEEDKFQRDSSAFSDDS
jgi:hypothetical protein